jgi:hypothetical protein
MAFKNSGTTLALLLITLSGCTDSDKIYASDTDAGLAGAGGDTGNETPDAGVAMACPDPTEAIDPTALIDDFEEPSPAIPAIGDRSGGWWTAGDDTPGATIVPELNSPARSEVVPGGRCGSTYAMRVTGQGFTDWGSILGMSFAYSSNGPVPYDASFREGITFWARIGDTSTNQMRFALSDVNSDPAGGVCMENGDPGTGCYDAFGVMISTLDTTWKRYKIPFRGLTQRDFGLPAEQSETTALYNMTFNFAPGAIFDFWVDDISFY